MTTPVFDRFALKGYVGQPGAAGSAGAAGTFARDNPGGRLTLVTGNPIPATDVTGGSATTIYYTPYLSNVISLYDGSLWLPTTFSEISASLSGLTTSQPYDVFGYLNSGVFTLELVVWSGGARVSGLSPINGVLLKNDGVFTKRYLGTIQLQATSQGEDSVLRRYVYNQYNRVPRSLRCTESTASWDYTLHTWRQANANTANQVSLVNGARSAIAISEMHVHLILNVTSNNLATSFANAGVREVGIGVDSTTAPHADCVYAAAGSSQAAITLAMLDHMPSNGRHDFTWLERSQVGSGTTPTTRWRGTGTLGGLHGLSGHVLL